MNNIQIFCCRFGQAKGMENVGVEGNYYILKDKKYFYLYRGGLVCGENGPRKFINEQFARKAVYKLMEAKE